MKGNKFWKVVSKVFTAVTVMVIVTLVLTSGTAAATQFKVLHAFTWAKSPTGNLTFDAAGNLYGTTSRGGTWGYGAVYKLAPNPDGSWMASILHSFKGTPTDGRFPQARLIFDTAGNLYGTTYFGGVDDIGVVFKLTPNPDESWTESTVYSFTGLDGVHPAAGLIFDAAGNLYGTTQGGGAYYWGAVFRLSPNPDGSWTESTLYSFCSPADCSAGHGPSGELIFDASGNLYGTTPWENDGYVFKLTPNPDRTWSESTLYAFCAQRYCCCNGPSAGPIFDAAGNLYGTTPSGGTYNAGTVYKLAPNPDGSWTESVLHSFTGADGAYPYAGLIFDAGGNLYGTTQQGGCAGYGVVFKLTPASSGWRETVLHDFLGVGKYPYAGLTMDVAGNLYGTASAGRNNYGIVFEITP